MYKNYLITIVILSLIIGCEVDDIQKNKPIANNDRAIVMQGIQNRINILSNDQANESQIDKSSIMITSQPHSGEIDIDTQSGEVIYTVSDFNQTQDMFKYKVKDQNGIISNEAVVILDIKKLITKAKNWYIKIIAIDQNNNIITSDTKFGELEDENVSQYNLKIYEQFNQANLSILLIDNNQKFKTIFYPHSDTSKKWNFILENHDTSADIVLKWQGVYVLDKFVDTYDRVRYKEYRYTKNPIVDYLKLVDKKSGVEIPAIQNGRICEYRFNMDGEHRREFEWILSDTKVKSNIFKPKSINKVKMQIIKPKIFSLDSPPPMDRMSYEQTSK